MHTYDLHVAGGTVVDGTRLPRFVGDVWISDGKIAQIGGRATGTSEKRIDATGRIVAPGFVDLHTHYDAQIRWDPYCTISGKIIVNGEVTFDDGDCTGATPGQLLRNGRG